MKIVKITNQINTTILSFIDGDGQYEKFKKAIINCIEHPLEYPLINYSDKKDDIIFTAEYLKSSIIFFSK